ncbi:MAG TPA: M20/M25/M40 family metallo-hydrolase [Sphingomicrobium sp.]|nr:M20/M25/M40 family metallo-hydrolase [Sphingomicrobium sp.]
MIRIAVAGLLLMSNATIAAPPSTPIRPDRAEFRALYQELVETNTTLSAGDCTLAAKKMADHLRAAGFPDSDLHAFGVADHPKEGGLVAVLPGADPKARPVLMLAHIDVVEAKREDWTRDPFKLVEEDGFFYGRGTTDDKAMAAIWVDTMARFKKDRFRPRRTLKMALTCGEETAGAFNGAEYLAKNQRQLIDAAFAINEGGGGQLDAEGKPVYLGVQVGEKLPQNYRLEVTNPGGHSSRPVPDNAIYHLAQALVRIEGYDFPVTLNPTTRDFFTRMAAIRGGEQGAAMKAIVANPADAAARAVLERDAASNSILHTTCVATMLEGGHATNALPQRARANVNCRIFPGTTTEDVRQTLIQVIADPKVSVTMPEVRSEAAAPPPLDPKVLGPAESLAAKMFPGVPELRLMQAGATDGAFLTPVGIPTYGISGMFLDSSLNGIHGLNEKISVAGLYQSRDYLYELMKIYANQAD